MRTRGPRCPGTQTLSRRQQIVRAGLAVFSSAGFHGASLRDIAERVGLSQAGLLHHYPSKERLLKAVLSWRDDRASGQLGDPPPDGLDLIRHLVEQPTAAPAREFVQLDVIVSAEGTSADYPVHGYVLERRARVLETVRVAFERAAAAGELRPDIDCATAARTVVALMDGLQLQWLLRPDAADVEGDLRRCLQPWLTTGL
jgi:AcrR family transcriptional regulator